MRASLLCPEGHPDGDRMTGVIVNLVTAVTTWGLQENGSIQCTEQSQPMCKRTLVNEKEITSGCEIDL